jgi:hypothetical protein
MTVDIHLVVTTLDQTLVGHLEGEIKEVLVDGHQAAVAAVAVATLAGLLVEAKQVLEVGHLAVAAVVAALVGQLVQAQEDGPVEPAVAAVEVDGPVVEVVLATLPSDCHLSEDFSKD